MTWDFDIDKSSMFREPLIRHKSAHQHNDPKTTLPTGAGDFVSDTANKISDSQERLNIKCASNKQRASSSSEEEGEQA